MALRCLLFCSDEPTASSIRDVLMGLGVEQESCGEAASAIEKVTNQAFQIVIIDWDQQPEAGNLLKTARERKAAERPLTLAIVSDDVSVPKALQAGANSILRKPILTNQVRDTLTTARDLLRAKQDSAANAALAAAVGASAGAASPARPGDEKTLRAGEFLQTSTLAPGGQFVTESEIPSPEEPAEQPIDPLKDLEPVAAPVQQRFSPPPPDEPRGLEWFLKNRAGVLPPVPARAPAPAAPEKPELLGFDQMPAQSNAEAAQPESEPQPPSEEAVEPEHQAPKSEDKLFSYITGEDEEPEKRTRPSFRLGKGTVIAALTLAACAVVAAPQAPWHPQLKALWKQGQQTLHGWLNPQPVTTAQAPDAHENFGRPGDEYKLPVPENIPDATTDPSQIQVLPVVDPTAKKTNNSATNADQPAGQPDGSTPAPGDQNSQAPANQVPANQVPANQVPANQAPANQAPANQVPANQSPAQVQENQPSQTAPVTEQPGNAPATGPTKPLNVPASLTTSPDQLSGASAPNAVTNPPATQPVAQKPAPPQYVAALARVPSSLKSSMASMTPEASGNKPIEAALPSIEPVDVPEATERGLLAEQPAIPYPANAKGMQGTVVLQVLVGRDGTVQDAKFIQGSLAFARGAIDGVRQWKFKPYMMNGRPVSVQTTLTMTFKPAP